MTDQDTLGFILSLSFITLKLVVDEVLDRVVVLVWVYLPLDCCMVPLFLLFCLSWCPFHGILTFLALEGDHGMKVVGQVGGFFMEVKVDRHSDIEGSSVFLSNIEIFIYFCHYW